MANWKDYANRAKAGAGRLAADLKQKNRRTAVINRLRTVLRCQERAAEKEYLILGRYYYNALRNKENSITEEHCAKLDEIHALLDTTLESLEQATQQSVDMAIIGGDDGPTAVYVGEKKKDGTLFHFGRGPLEITVTRDSVYHPEDEDSEEIDLNDVESFDHDPMAEDTLSPVEPETTTPTIGAPAELDENDGLPFEG